MPSHLGLKSIKFRVKSHPHPILSCILFSIAFCMDVYRFVVDSHSPKPPKINQKSIKSQPNNQTTKHPNNPTIQARWWGLPKAIGHCLGNTYDSRNGTIKGDRECILISLETCTVALPAYVRGYLTQLRQFLKGVNCDERHSSS